MRIVHLSDIHFGQERNGTYVFHEDVRAELLKDCAGERERGGPAEGIIITGDIAYSGKALEYRNANAWLAELAVAAGCKTTGIKVIPGNHDVDINEIGYSSRMAHQDLRGASPDKVQAILQEISSGSELLNPLIGKLKAYREFAAGYGCDFSDPADPGWDHPVRITPDHQIRFIGLNSVQVSDKDDNDKKGTLVLGNKQYTISREQNVENVVLVHHPLDWFKDKRQAQEYLHSRAKVLMMGHEHLPSIEKIASETDDERLVISSGATNPPEADFDYTYNWIEFSVVDQFGEPKLAVRVAPRKWVRGQTRFMADKARLNGKDSKEFILKCPMFSASRHAKPNKTVDEQPSEKPVIGSMVESSKEEDFARLRYFFWRFLDWRQRLQVLSKLDILPKSTDRPVPQTLERLALDSARKQKKLGLLWDAVMEIMPANERESNPFNG